jgi:hypothetical protein
MARANVFVKSLIQQIHAAVQILDMIYQVPAILRPVGFQFLTQPLLKRSDPEQFIGDPRHSA